MVETVSATDANGDFSRILRDVRNGHSYVVASHGRPIARIVPMEWRARGVGCTRGVAVPPGATACHRYRALDTG